MTYIGTKVILSAENFMTSV